MGIGETGAVTAPKPHAHADNSSPPESVKQFNDALDWSADSKDASSTQYSSDTPDSTHSQGTALQSCIDPTLPTAREESMQQSLQEEERYLPSGAVPLQSVFTRATIPSAEPGTNFAREAARGRRLFNINNPPPAGTNAQHWTKEISARNTNIHPDVMNQNMSHLQSRNALPAQTLLTDPNGGGTTYTVDNGSTYGNEHKFADRHLIPEIEAQIRAANPNVDPRHAVIDAGRQARWVMTGEPGPEPAPEARSSARVVGPTTSVVVNGAAIAGLAGRTLTQLHEGRPKEALTTATVGTLAYVALTKVPALVPLAVMKSSIDSYDKEIEQKAFADGEWWEDATGSTTVGAIAASASATGRSVFEGTFGVTGRAIGEGAAVVYTRLSDDKYTLVPWKAQWWSDVFD